MAAETAGQTGTDDLAEGDPAEIVQDAAPIEAVAEPLAADPEILAVLEPTRPPRRSSGFLGLVSGGVIAAGLGFGLGQYGVPDGWPLAAPVEVQPEIAALAAMQAKLDAMAVAPQPVDTALMARLTALEAALAETGATPDDALAFEPRFAALEARVAKLETLPLAGGGSAPIAVTGLQTDLAALKAELERQKAAVAASVAAATALSREQLATAEALTKASAIKTDLAEIQRALDSGEAFAAALQRIEGRGVFAPEALRTLAPEGVPSLRVLQDGFPEAARAALEASLRSDMGETLTERMTAFLRSQTGARSLTPREGSDPDAILSRAEAALTAGDVTAALAEAKALPAEGQAALADWVALAEIRLNAMEAFAELTAQLAKE